MGKVFWIPLKKFLIDRLLFSDMPTTSLVSVIIPAYNAEKSIVKCVDSILCQTYNNIEILIVDDGSNDSTGSIIDSLAKQYSNVFSFHQENAGPNVARAKGIANAKGEWLTFVDSDDTLVFNGIEHLLFATSAATDIIVGFSFENNTAQYTMPIDDWRASIIKSDVILCTPWGKLFRKSILGPEVCEIRTAKNAGEDMPMNIKIAFRTEKMVTIIPGKIYNYTIDENSVSHRVKWSVDRITNLYDDVVSSIPCTQRDNYIDCLIENRLISIRNFILGKDLKSKEKIGKTRYVDCLKNDIKKSGYKLSISSFFYVNNSDSILTFLLVRGNQHFLVLRQFIKRLLNGDVYRPFKRCVCKTEH